MVVRYRDFLEIIENEPRCIEFHLTDKDLEESPPKGNYKQSLIIHVPEFFGDKLVDICTDNRKLRDASLSIIQQSITVAKTLATSFSGIPKMVVHPGAMSLNAEPKPPSYYQKNILQSLRFLHYEGVELLLENQAPRPWYFGGQWYTHYFSAAEDLLWFTQKTKLGVCYDVSHSKLYCNVTHTPLLSHIQLILPYVRHLHISDASGIDGEGLQIGDGTVDFIGILRLLKKRYTGTLVPEIWRGHLENGKGFLLAVEKLAEIYEQLERIP